MIRIFLLGFVFVFPSMAVSQGMNFELEKTSNYVRLLILSNASRLIQEEVSDQGGEYIFPENTSLSESVETLQQLSTPIGNWAKFNVEGNVLVASILCDCSVQSYSAGANLYVIEVRKISDSSYAKFQQVRENVSLPVEMANGSDVLASKNSDAVVENGNLEEDASELGALEIFDFRGGQTLGVWESRSSNDRLVSALQSRVQGSATQSSSSGFDPSGTDRSDAPQIRFVPTESVSGQSSMELDDSIDCDAVSHVDPLNWEVSDDAVGALFLNRSISIDEAGDIVRGEAWRMANGYLTLAMGAEAAYILRSTVKLEETDPIFDIAEALDTGILDPNFLSLAFSECSETIVWMTLVEKAVDARDVSNIASIFLEWPPYVQDAFSAQLAEIFRSNGFENEAGLVLRLSSTNSAELSLFQAENYVEQSESQDALRLLSNVVDSDGDLAPAAAAKLTTIAVDQGVEIGPRYREVLEVYAQERKGTQDEGELLKAQILLSISDSDFDLAFSQLDELKKWSEPREISTILETIASKLLSLQSDASFLREVNQVQADIFRQFPIESQNEMRARVVALGFVELAKELGQLRRPNPETFAAASDSNSVAPEETVEASEGLTEESGSESEQDLDEAAAGSVVSEASQEGVVVAPVTGFVAPIPDAIEESSSLLSQVDELKQELEQLGL